MSMERWDPFRDMLTLREAMDHLFQESFVRPTSAMLAAARGTIPVDLTESGDTYVIRATMPGINPDNIQISVHDNILTIRGEASGEAERKDENYILRERHAASFNRSISLPSPVDADHAQARYENGVLTLTLPKSPVAQPRQIPISTTLGQSSQRQLTDTQTPQQASSTAQTTQTSTPPTQQGASQQDRIDEASAESFPASDSPSWSPSSS
ncbi:MAG: Hsp20/alpha crystallin family protein [Ktedonobacterales bacterium]